MLGTPVIPQLLTNVNTALVKLLLVKIVSVKSASFKSVLLKSALVKLAPVKLVFFNPSLTRYPSTTFQQYFCRFSNSVEFNLLVFSRFAFISLASNIPLKTAPVKSALGPTKYPFTKFQLSGKIGGFWTILLLDNQLTPPLFTPIKFAPVKSALVTVVPVKEHPDKSTIPDTLVKLEPVKFIPLKSSLLLKTALLKSAPGPTRYPLINFHCGGNLVELPDKSVIILPLLTPVNVAELKSTPVKSVPVKTALIKPLPTFVKFAFLPTKNPLINFQPEGKWDGIPWICPLITSVKVAPDKLVPDKSTLVRVEPDKSKPDKLPLVKSAPSPTRYPLVNLQPYGNRVVFPDKSVVIPPLLTPVKFAEVKSVLVKVALDKLALIKPSPTFVKVAVLPTKNPLINFQPDGKLVGVP